MSKGSNERTSSAFFFFWCLEFKAEFVQACPVLCAWHMNFESLAPNDSADKCDKIWIQVDQIIKMSFLVIVYLYERQS